MIEFLKRHYVKEEVFLDEFGNVAAVAARHLDHAWQPDLDCDDDARRDRDYFRSTGELTHLAFDSAAVYHDADGFPSAQIVVRSAKRIVTVRVTRSGSDLVAETVVDRDASAVCQAHAPDGRGRERRG